MLIAALSPSMKCLQCFYRVNASDEITMKDAGDDKCCDMSIEEPCKPDAMLYGLHGPDEMVKLARNNRLKHFCRNQPMAACCCFEDLCNKDFASFMHFWTNTAYAEMKQDESLCANRAIEQYKNMTGALEGKIVFSSNNLAVFFGVMALFTGHVEKRDRP
ncbi:hypothetical protein GCK32_011046 [Trichostrongylus colubriformis]|uniref:Uncharacterized protein n=1 Tax=Trichostrongylus colubriformis TaxID=6319 RepID=A0AAN8IXT8_TRICO